VRLQARQPLQLFGDATKGRRERQPTDGSWSSQCICGPATRACLL